MSYSRPSREGVYYRNIGYFSIWVDKISNKRICRFLSVSGLLGFCNFAYHKSHSQCTCRFLPQGSDIDVNKTFPIQSLGERFLQKTLFYNVRTLREAWLSFMKIYKKLFSFVWIVMYQKVTIVAKPS